MRQATPIGLLVVLLLPSLLLAAAPQAALSTRILSASPAQTTVLAEFDGAALNQRLTTPDPDVRLTDGLGVILAVAGEGTPRALVVNVVLGEAVAATLDLDEREVAASTDELVMLSEPAVLKDLRIVTLDFRPLVRADGQVRMVEQIEAEVRTDGLGGRNTVAAPRSFSSAFYPLYHTFVANLDEIYPEISLRAPGRYLLIGPQSRLDSLAGATAYQRWLDLKRRKGYEVQVVGLADPTENNLRQAIRDAYDDEARRDLEYTLIVGDHFELPGLLVRNPEHPNEQPSVGDNQYFTLAGGDTLPDVLYGRVSGVSRSDYVHYFNKVVQYETNPYTENMQWYRTVTCVAGNFSDDFTFPVTPVWNAVWARWRLMRDGCITQADTFFWHSPQDPPPGDYTLPIQQDINDGTCAVIYRGWADSQGWQYPVFRNEHARELQNGPRTPAVYGMVCGSGNYAFPSGACLGEVFTTGQPLPNAPNGAISYLGASDLHTNTRHNNAILAGIVEALMTGGIRSGGALLLAGKLEGWRQFPLERGGETPLAFFYILHVFNLLGDPETQTYMCEPGTFANVIHPDQVTVGENLINVGVQTDGQGIEGAVVTARALNSQEVTSALTDAQGQVWLPLNLADASQPVQLTIWKGQYFLRTVEVPVVNAAFDPKIEAINWTAGADNLPNPGETASFTLTVRNVGTAALASAITVTSDHPSVTITNGTGSLEAVPPGQTGTTSQFAINLSGELVNAQEPRLSVLFSDGGVTRRMEIVVAAPDPVVMALNTSGPLEPGGTVTVTPVVLNVGGQDATNLTAQITSWDNSVSFPDNQTTWAAVPMGQSAGASDPFTVTAAAGVTPGRQVLVRFDLTHNGVIVARKAAFLTVGTVTINAPTGPDAYGYWAYENIDAGYPKTPAYDWVELDPALGGSGEPHQVRDESVFDMALPRAFTFYGASHDHIWVCSNGWVSFAEGTRLPEFRNWELPSPMGPPYMICPFWEDLVIDRTWPNNDSVHTVWTLDDPGHNRFIIQWRAFNRGGLNASGNPNTAFCTFQVMLEYPSSGDGDILVQYNQITQVDPNGQGNFATVGIQDDRHQRGLTLTYANMYPASVAALEANRAIRFSTTPPDNFTGADTPRDATLPERLALHEAYPNPFNPATELRFDVPKAGNISLRVYDMLGREVAVLVDGYRAAGSYRITFDGRQLATGLYFARLTAGSETQVRKLMLLK